MNIVELISLREKTAVKFAAAEGRGFDWRGLPFVTHEDRVIADRIIKAGLTLEERV